MSRGPGPHPSRQGQCGCFLHSSKRPGLKSGLRGQGKKRPPSCPLLAPSPPLSLASSLTEPPAENSAQGLRRSRASVSPAVVMVNDDTGRHRETPACSAEAPPAELGLGLYSRKETAEFQSYFSELATQLPGQRRRRRWPGVPFLTSWESWVALELSEEGDPLW